MELENIFQWTDSYPSYDILTNDIRNEELYELRSKEEILGVICLNSNQEPEYRTIDWLDKAGSVALLLVSVVFIISVLSFTLALVFG